MKIEQNTLFNIEKTYKKNDITPKTENKKSFNNVFDIQFVQGNDKNKLQNDGIAMLRILGSRFSKSVFSKNFDPHPIVTNLMTILKCEKKIKKGILPQELSVKDAFFQCLLKKNDD